MQRVHQGLEPHGQGESEQDFDLVVVDPLEHLVAHDSGRQCQHHGSAHFLEQQHAHRADIERKRRGGAMGSVQAGKLQKNQKDDDT